MSTGRKLAPSAYSGSRAGDLQSITRDGAYFSVMVGLGESYVPAFALATGLGDVTSGLVTTIPMLIGACLQLVTPLAVGWLRSYKRWVVACARVQALSFLPLIIGAAIGRVSLLWVGIATVTYWASGMATGPAWNAWVTSLVPSEIRGTFFARRSRIAQTALVAGLLLGGIALQLGREKGAELTVFALLFGGAMIARGVSSRFLAAQSERADLSQGHRALGPVAVWRLLRGTDSLRALRYLLLMQVAVNVASPYFTPYMLRHLALSYGEFMVLTAAAFVSRIAILPLLGRVASARGTRIVLWLGGFGIVPLPALWLCSDAFAYLFAIQLLAGCAWAAIELGTTLSFFEGIEEDHRASVLSLFNVANAVAIATGSLVGAYVLVRFDGSMDVYVWLFGFSSVARLIAVALLPRTTAAPHVVPEIQLRTLAVRPGGVAVQRPILASFDSALGPPAGEPPAE